MKIALIGTIPPCITYGDWLRIFRRHFWARCVKYRTKENTISEIGITAGSTLLNSYVKTFAADSSIPLKVYGTGDATEDAETKRDRNVALVQNADLVMAFTTKSDVSTVKPSGESIPIEGGRNVIVVPVGPTDHKDMAPTEDDVALVEQIQRAEGDVEAAKNELIAANRKFVLKIAQQSARKHPASQLTLEELIEEGNKGLILAAQKYDPSKGFKFISYAIWHIRQSIEEAITNQ